MLDREEKTRNNHLDNSLLKSCYGDSEGGKKNLGMFTLTRLSSPNQLPMPPIMIINI